MRRDANNPRHGGPHASGPQAGCVDLIRTIAKMSILCTLGA